MAKYDLALWQARRQIVLAHKGRGLTTREIALAVKDTPEFAGISSINSLAVTIHNLLNGKRNWITPIAENITRDVVVKQKSILDSLSVPSLSTLKDQEEFQRWVNRVLKPAVRGLERERSEFAELKRRVSEFESHVCPNADAALLEENQQLKERIAFLGKRVEALSKLTTPRPLSDAHLAFPGR